MKKCPFCQADIEDNARFCVFCMSSLQEKEKIENQPKNNKRWPYILAAFLLLVLIFGIIVFTLSKNKANNSLSEALTQSEINDLNDNNGLLTDNTDNVDNHKNNNNDNNGVSQGDNDSELNEQNSTANDTENKTTQGTGDKPIITVPETGDTTNDATNNTTNNENSTEQGNDDQNNTDKNSEEQGNDDVPTKIEAVYTYRDAVAADCYTEGNIPAQPITDVIVITGVSRAASDGIYTIPEEINGKRVGAIMPNTFCDPTISGTVKKVIVSTSVKTIWQNAFSNCYNLTDIYLCGKIIDIYESAFANKDNRIGTLTIHCSSDCKTFGFYYYRNIVDNYNATYQEWNGGEIE